jgi:hypothetical protein
MSNRRMTRRAALACAGLACVLPSCEWDGHFTVLGYTTRPNYNTAIRTVRVPLFENRTFRQGVEFDLTRAVIREIEAKTPYKVVSHCNADTELTGKITGIVKNLVNVSQLNEIREGEMVVTVEVIWKDLRTGKILSQPARRPGDPLPIEVLADSAGRNMTGDPSAVALGINGPAYPTRPEVAAAPAEPAPGGPALVAPLPGEPAAAPQPVVLSSRGNFIPELGQSVTSALQVNCNRLAVQIVNMMENPW